jgi:hypothetical protein
MGETHGEMLGINGCCTRHSRTDIMWEAGMVEVRELIGTSLTAWLSHPHCFLSVFPSAPTSTYPVRAPVFLSSLLSNSFVVRRPFDPIAYTSLACFKWVTS